MSVPESIHYRREFVKTFTVGATLLKDRCTPESMSQGRSCVFDVASAGGRMQRRSIDGRIPRTNVTDTQVTCTLEEHVRKEEVTDFEAFTSQSEERQKLNWRMMESVNEELDYNFFTEIANATNLFSASAAPITHQTIGKVIATLAENKVRISPQNVTWMISPMLEAKLEDMAGYTSTDYVSSKVLESGGQFGEQLQAKVWRGITWIIHPNLPSVGEASVPTYIWHKRAMGCAVPTSQMKYSAGYDDQDHFHYCSATLKAGHKILQNSGILKFLHDDTA